MKATAKEFEFYAKNNGKVSTLRIFYCKIVQPIKRVYIGVYICVMFNE